MTVTMQTKQNLTVSQYIINVKVYHEKEKHQIYQNIGILQIGT